MRAGRIQVSELSNRQCGSRRFTAKAQAAEAFIERFHRWRYILEFSIAMSLFNLSESFFPQPNGPAFPTTIRLLLFSCLAQKSLPITHCRNMRPGEHTALKYLNQDALS